MFNDYENCVNLWLDFTFNRFHVKIIECFKNFLQQAILLKFEIWQFAYAILVFMNVSL